MRSATFRRSISPMFKLIVLLVGWLVIIGSVVGLASAAGSAGSWADGVQWLRDRQVPNSTVPTPAPGREGLVLSYIIPQSDPAYPFLFSRSWIYDDALAVIAWSMEGECQSAENTLSALDGLVDTDGKLGFSYNTTDNWFHTMYRTGAIAWVGYSFVFYQKMCGDSQFQATAESIADWTLTMQDSTTGSVKGGPDVNWFSTEHNIDTYFFLRDIGLLTDKTAYLEAANRIKQSLLDNHWNSAHGCFQRGINDPVKALDAASWGALFLLSIGQQDKADSCLDVIEASFPVTVSCDIGGGSQNISGYKPYIGTVDGIDWDQIAAVWSEGSLGVAMAYRRAGGQAKHDEIVSEIWKMKDTGEGIVYACPPVTDFPNWESVAGTAWMVMLQSVNSDCFWNSLACQAISTEPADEYKPQIARYGARVYVAWYDTSDTVFLANSTDNGQTWGQPIMVISGTHPAITAAMDGTVHLAYRDGNTIKYTQSTDDGQSFTSSVILGDGGSPDIAVDLSGNPYVVWQEECNTPGQDTNIILARSTDQGLSFVDPRTIVGLTTKGYSEPPRMAVSPSGDKIYVIWKAPPQYPAYVRTYFARSVDGGDTFEPRFNPTGFTHHGEYSPDVAAFGEDAVYITWVLDQYYYRRVHFARSEDSGKEGSFSPRVALGESGSDFDSTIATDDRGRVCVAWRQRDTTYLYFRCSGNGESFQSTRMVCPLAPQYKPALYPWYNSGATCLDVVWEDERNGNRDIFYHNLCSSLPVTNTYLPIVVK